MPAKPLLVLDSASLYYRSYFALPSSMTAPDGQPHNAIRGFLSTVARLIDTHGAAGVVACWDADWRPQWRVDLLPSYKAHRVAAEDAVTGTATDPGAEAEPEDLGPQAQAIAGILDALGMPRWGVAGYEADDVAASVARQLPGPVIVVTGDRDLVQLVDDRVRVLLAVNGGMEKWPLLDPPAVVDRFGVPAGHYVDLAVLRGDPSDGLPGVPGIGAKTAAALVAAFGGCGGIRAAADAEPVTRPLTPRLAAAIREAGDYLDRAVPVATAVADLPLPARAAELPTAPADADALDDLARRWGVERQVREVQAAIARQTDPGQTDDE
jgi:5'-3' exonuclease